LRTSLLSTNQTSTYNTAENLTETNTSCTTRTTRSRSANGTISS